MYAIKFETFGCRLNQSESEALATLFKDSGFNVSNTFDNADVVMVFFNTCTVTSKAEQKARRVIRQCLRNFPNAVMLVTGCYAQLESVQIEAIDSRVVCLPGKHKDLLLLLPTKMANLWHLKNLNVSTICDAIRDLNSPSVLEKSFSIPLEKRRFSLNTSKFLFHSRASLKIQDGCNNACSFCRIHIARGQSVSLPVLEVIERAKKIEASGAHEIVLTGVNLSQYSDDSKDFADIVKIILDSTDSIRIRISSIYPEAVTPKFLDILKDNRICPHFHLSVQSGSSEILKRMKRPYNVDKMLFAVEQLKSVKIQPFLGCDIITGFPGESEEDFEKTIYFCKKGVFSGIHAFPFSARPNTVAYNMKPKIPQRISGERVAILNDLAQKNYKTYLESCNGMVVHGIVENTREDDAKKILTENYLLLPLKCDNIADKYPKGSDVIIKITDGVAVPITQYMEN